MIDPDPVTENENLVKEGPSIEDVYPHNHEEVVEKKKRSKDLSRFKPNQKTIFAVAAILLTVFTSYLYQHLIRKLK